MRHRPPGPGELETRFRRDVVIKVNHRLTEEGNALLEEALAQVRASHQAVHEATAVITESIAFQSSCGQETARRRLSAVISAATEARAMLELDSTKRFGADQRAP